MRRKIIILTCATLLLVIIQGCKKDRIVSPKAFPKPEGYPKENIIGKLVLSYKDRDIDLYQKLLHEDYVWYFHPDDVWPGNEDHISRETEIHITNNIFNATRGLYQPAIERLSLEISDGPWLQVYSIDGETCSDCWMTERNYNILIEIEETIFLAIGSVQFFIAPADELIPGKYEIISAHEIRYNSLHKITDLYTKGTSWGSIKLLFYDHDI